MSEKKYEEIYFVDTQKPVWNYSLFTQEDIIRFQQGIHCRLYNLFGNHALNVLNHQGIYFAVWAPNASDVSVIGDFNDWKHGSHRLYSRLDRSGIWEGFIPGLSRGNLYKYAIESAQGRQLEKGDPFALYWEQPPKTASVCWELDYSWKDDGWMEHREQSNGLTCPISVYEMHLGSWMRPDPFNEKSYNSYRMTSDLLVPYLDEMHFSHVEFMPVMEHPFDGSWGYQLTGYYAPTSRYGTPEDFAFLVDSLHRKGIGVILDWVPSHFPYDAHGLFEFDGTHTYEYADMRKGYHPDWKSYIFNYQRGEVRSFLLSNAHFWCERFHADGIRVDAVSSMLRLDYSRSEGQWEANSYGGNGNIEAIAFLKLLNETLYRDFPSIQTIAEEATDWPGVSRPTSMGGLGFGMKWMMGWMHDTLKYFGLDPIIRGTNQDSFTFSMMYFQGENYMLPLSHDEVVHCKSPMIYKMNGDTWQKFANLRLLYTYMYTHPGTKLLFMGDEFASNTEWNYKGELPWGLLQLFSHSAMQNCVKSLNLLYHNEPALYERQFESDGFEWLDLNHKQESVVVYLRKGKHPKDNLVIILNLTPVVRWNWTIKVFGAADWEEIFNSDSADFWGSGNVYNPDILSEPIEGKEHGFRYLRVHLPPLSGIVLRQKQRSRVKDKENEPF